MGCEYSLPVGRRNTATSFDDVENPLGGGFVPTPPVNLRFRRSTNLSAPVQSDLIEFKDPIF